MSQDFTPRLDILPGPQRRLWDELGAVPGGFVLYGGTAVALLDLAGTKAAVVQMRAEAKDYLDIDALLTVGGMNLGEALAAASVIYGQSFNPQLTLKALSYFDDGNLRRLAQPVRVRLARAAREVDLDRLPPIPVPRGSP